MNQVIVASPNTIRTLSGVPASFRIAALMLLKTERGELTFLLPDGRELVFRNKEAGPKAMVEVHDYGFIRKAMAGGDVGFADAYIEGMWSTPDLTEVLRFFSANFEAAGQLARGGWIVRSMNMLRHMFARRNSREGAKKNIIAHYDLGNAFYEKWLDPSMTYSSALFESPNQSLQQGQMNKYGGICDRIQAGPSSHILEIGCGWGGFAEYAAKHRGSKVTCLTISPSQRDFALARMQREGLSERVDIRLEDYRDHQGQYDGVASIEMFEAVGEAYWPSYFDKVFSSLKAGGRAALQIITIDDALFDRYRQRVDFIQQHIFPGGMLISEEALKGQFSKAGLRHDGVSYFGQDYARTCREWARAFNGRWDEIRELGFDEPFRRLWNFYLSYCEAGFSDGRINVGQFQVTRPA
ncbi:cyclopropane-fatty-acyl-phospholipid synthase family protein [Hyphomonas sp. WL0036]|uniref:SAM-dependent methyltransferase n=1 Tax=Hyphomonas sediminis TaxID=2866160 RepID=UPI001C7FDAA2|nr:cyclopropane-fatty-acyl-phospholipid synthase family protein [Hyphomonas sediminis]MBY9067599.1 cyclopropane-fatty-acyl-phospholipid synthase family protein [Hyphomonas sediminis]